MLSAGGLDIWVAKLSTAWAMRFLYFLTSQFDDKLAIAKEPNG